MEGIVLGVDAEEGVIRTADGTRYRFKLSEWKSPRAPQPKDRVDFVPDLESAREVYLLGHGTGLADMLEDARGSERTVPAIVYACYLAALLWGVTMIIGVVLAYVYRGNCRSAFCRSHFDYQTEIFWKSMIGVFFGVLLLFFGIGAVILLLTYVWVIYKTIKGWRSLNQGEAILPG